MKRINSTLLIAALPALGLSTNLFLGLFPSASSGPTAAAAPQQQEGAQEGDPSSDPDADPDGALEEDENPPPEGIGPDPRIGYDIFGRRTRVRGNTFADRIRGGWMLTRIVIPGSNPRGRLAQGFMHIGESFMSMELHALWESGSSNSIPENDVHTTFTAEYKVDSSGKMFCSTIIGSYIDEETGELRWERAGYEREYRISETLEELQITYVDPEAGTGEMYFKPFVPRTLGSKDIFGRNEIGSFGATDIFGRKKAAIKGERDIYGRPVTPPAEPEDDDVRRKLAPKGPGAVAPPLSGRGGR